jgi:Superinfection immunity protein
MGTLVLIIIGFAFYFLPSLVAGSRGAANTSSVIVVNLFLGWTFLGWVVALAMAVGGTSGRTSAPPGLTQVVCPRCNMPQNIPAEDTKFECWQCHYVATRVAKKPSWLERIGWPTEPAPPPIQWRKKKDDD